jgi:hypothetical protein
VLLHFSALTLLGYQSCDICKIKLREWKEKQRGKEEGRLGKEKRKKHKNSLLKAHWLLNPLP